MPFIEEKKIKSGIGDNQDLFSIISDVADEQQNFNIYGVLSGYQIIHEDMHPEMEVHFRCQGTYNSSDNENINTQSIQFTETINLNDRKKDINLYINCNDIEANYIEDNIVNYKQEIDINDTTYNITFFEEVIPDTLNYSIEIIQIYRKEKRLEPSAVNLSQNYFIGEGETEIFAVSEYTVPWERKKIWNSPSQNLNNIFPEPRVSMQHNYIQKIDKADLIHAFDKPNNVVGPYSINLNVDNPVVNMRMEEI